MSRPAADTPKRTTKTVARKKLARKAAPPATPAPSLKSQIRSVAGQVWDWAGIAAEIATGIAKPLVKNPASQKAVAAAGKFLRDARETAGISIDDLAQAIKLEDHTVLELAESGKVAIPFEIILRIASLLARNDPIPFVVALSRGYAPGVWKAFEQLGMGNLVMHTAREHEFINIYRSRDSLRTLSDAEFAHLLGFVGSAVDTTAGLIDGLKKPDAKPRKG
jgi:transcriptional regulator with XRE-family HTH domain